MYIFCQLSIIITIIISVKNCHFHSLIHQNKRNNKILPAQLVGSFLRSPFHFWTPWCDLCLYHSRRDLAFEYPLQLRMAESSCCQLADTIAQAKNTFSSLTITSTTSWRLCWELFKFFRKTSTISTKTLNTMSLTWISFPLSTALVHSVESCTLFSVSSATSCKHLLSSSFCLFLDLFIFFKRDLQRKI